jgi:sortase B
MKAGKIVYTILVILLTAVFFVSGYHVAKYYIESRQQKAHYDDLASIVESIQNAEPEPTQTQPTDPTPPEATQDTGVGESVSTEPSPTEPALLPEYQVIYEMNPDLVGWLKFDNSRINYPVMQTPAQADFYLYRNFNKEYSSQGCIFAQGSSDINKPSDNITLYGHNMRDGSMFAGLSSYLRQSYWENNSTFRFDTLTEHHTYQIFAVFKTTASIGQGFDYHNFIDAANEEEFNRFIANCKDLSFYDTGITPVYGDKIICLSTCEYTQVNGRFVVAAVRIS